MRVSYRAVGPAAISLVALLALCGRLGADDLHLFPPNVLSDSLSRPGPDDDDPALLRNVTLIDLSDPPADLRLSLRMPEKVLLLGPSGIPSPTVTKFRTLGQPLKPWATGLIVATTISYQIANSVKETSHDGFHFTSEGFFGQHTYAGGVDKAAHLVDYTIAQRALMNTYRRVGYTSTQSAWLGFGTVFAAGLTNEIGDGTTLFGFSYEDLVMDTLGAGTATVLQLTGWNDTFGFRFGPISQQESPSCCLDFSNVGRDYSGEIYTADFKIAGLARRLRFDPGPARFLLFSVTYGTNGYNTGIPEIRQRLVGLEVGIHFSEILRALGVPSEPLWGEVLYYFFDTFRIPYTAIGVRFDLNHNEWFAPTVGRTPFRVPSGR